MSTLDRIAGKIGRTVAAGCLAGRTLLPFDTNPVPGDWEHVTKVDPEDAKKLPIAYPRYLQHTDGISVGGSADVTETNTVETFQLLSTVPTPAFHEPSAAGHVTEETLSAAAFLAVPQVLNGDDEAFVGTLGTGTRFIREKLAPAAVDELAPGPIANRFRDPLAEFLTHWMLYSAAFEAYIIQNPDSAAAREGGVTESDLLTPRQAADRAMAAERYLGSEVLYLEYSGTFGGEEAVDILEETAPGISWTRLWYGGGIDSREKAERVLEAGADTVVVGDVFHRIAAEETEFASSFLSESETGASAHPDRIESWLEENVDLDGTAAAEYLSTIPSVTHPVRTARHTLVAGIAAHCILAGATADVREAIDAGRLSAPDELSSVFRDDYADTLSSQIAPTDGGSGSVPAFAGDLLAATALRAYDDAAESPTDRSPTAVQFPVHHLSGEQIRRS